MKNEAILTLIEYNTWANQRLLGRSIRLTPKQLKEKISLSYDSILGTLIHILETQWFWRRVCQEGSAPEETLGEAYFPDMKSLQARWQEEDEQLHSYASSLSDEQLTGEVQLTLPRVKPRTWEVWQILTHIVNHGTHHRGEVGQYLASLGRSPRDLDFIIYVSRKRA